MILGVLLLVVYLVNIAGVYRDWRRISACKQDKHIWNIIGAIYLFGPLPIVAAFIFNHGRVYAYHYLAFLGVIILSILFFYFSGCCYRKFLSVFFQVKDKKNRPIGRMLFLPLLLTLLIAPYLAESNDGFGAIFVGAVLSLIAILSPFYLLSALSSILGAKFLNYFKGSKSDKISEEILNNNDPLNQMNDFIAAIWGTIPFAIFIFYSQSEFARFTLSFLRKVL